MYILKVFDCFQSLAVGNNYGSMYRDNDRWDKENHRIIIKSKATSDPISDSKYRYTGLLFKNWSKCYEGSLRSFEEENV
ncbi:hypothetical protein V6x_51670 [Gimesia chilikensis]|uniref:Uncharacterized protein n=1 Tax=Gimesia chilikensis TaxID=2605989 RepID=A0A517WJK2_9PLAN|nr:hypothetical protein V6x_51670 [Gimesia chilikensis]